MSGHVSRGVAVALALLAATQARAGTLSFVDVTAQSGLAGFKLQGGDLQKKAIPQAMPGGVAWIDYDLDGDWDLLLVGGGEGAAPKAGTRDGHGHPPALFRNMLKETGKAVFVDVTNEVGLSESCRHAWGMGVVVADYDGDGDPDIYFTNLGPNELWRNDTVRDGKRSDHPHFTEVAHAAGVDVSTWSTGATFADVDGDGDLDLYVAAYVDFDPAYVPPNQQFTLWRGLTVFPGPVGLPGAADHFYRNMLAETGKATFQESTASAGLTDTRKAYGFAAMFLDADGDGDQDLFVANDSTANLLYLNDGHGHFTERGFLAGVAYSEDGKMQAGMGAAIGDCDGDGRPDLAVTNFSYDYYALYQNRGAGRFDDVSYASGFGAATYLPLGFGITWLDADRDGDEDLFVANGHIYPEVDSKNFGTTYAERNQLFENLSTGGKCLIKDASADAGPGLTPAHVGRGCAAADYDGDGDLDVIVNDLDSAPLLLRNDTAPARGWLVVSCAGRAPNRFGIGALVTATAAGRAQVREIRSSASYLSSEPPVAFFGLGDVSTADVTVRFPSGRLARCPAVKAGQVFVVSEP